MEFCDWILNQDADFSDRVLWTDEKLWVEKTHPNKQNERYWSQVDPEVEVGCREQGGKKIMCWAGLINGKIILHWFPLGTSVNQQVYLEMLCNCGLAKNKGSQY